MSETSNDRIKSCIIPAGIIAVGLFLLAFTALTTAAITKSNERIKALENDVHETVNERLINVENDLVLVHERTLHIERAIWPKTPVATEPREPVDTRNTAKVSTTTKESK
jgi:hypothetical protein